MKRSALIEACERIVQAAKSQFKEFADKLEGNDPLYELSWGDSALREAATISQYLRHLRNEGLTLKRITQVLTEELTDAARSPESSTSQMHNIAAVAKNVAKAELLIQMQKCVED